MLFCIVPLLIYSNLPYALLFMFLGVPVTFFLIHPLIISYDAAKLLLKAILDLLNTLNCLFLFNCYWVQGTKLTTNSVDPRVKISKICTMKKSLQFYFELVSHLSTTDTRHISHTQLLPFCFHYFWNYVLHQLRL